MIPDETPSHAPRDHNQPTELVTDPVGMLVAAQRAALEPFEQRRDQIVEAANKKQITDRFTLGDGADIIRIASQVYEKIDRDRKDRTDPYRRAADAAKGAAEEFWEPAYQAVSDLRRRMNAWTAAEDERIAAQQAEQKAEMQRLRKASQEATGVADAVSAPATNRSSPPAMLPAKRYRARGDLGATVTTVDKAEYTVTDVRAIPDLILNSPTVHAAIIQVVKSMAKHMPDVPGVTRSSSLVNQIR